MFEDGTYEYGLKTGDLPEKEMVKIFEKALSKVAEEINDSRIPKKRKLKRVRSVAPPQMQNHQNMIISIFTVIDPVICFYSCTLIEKKMDG